MARTHQQVTGASTAVNEQTHNGQYSAIDEVEEQAWPLSNVEQNVNTMRAAMEPVEAMMMNMAQSLQTQPLQQLIQQQHNQVQREEQRSSYVNGGTHQQRERSLQGSVSVSTRKNAAIIGQRIAPS